MSEPMKDSLLDMLGMDQAKMAALAESVGVDMLGKMEPTIVAWVQEHAAPMLQSLLDHMEPAIAQWVNENLAPAVQSLLDALKTSLEKP